jgi:hypothetical protein
MLGIGDIENGKCSRFVKHPHRCSCNGDSEFDDIRFYQWVIPIRNLQFTIKKSMCSNGSVDSICSLILENWYNSWFVLSIVLLSGNFDLIKVLI